MQESEQSSNKSDTGFKVAPLISDHKLSQFKVKIVGTLLGLSFWNKNHQDQQTEDYCECSLLNILYYILLPCIVIIPPMIISETNLYPVAVIIPAVLLPICHLVYVCSSSQKHHISTYIILIIYGYLWSNQLYICQDLLEYNQNVVTLTLALSILCIIFSVTGITTSPPQQFAGTSMHYQIFGLDSSFGVRFLISVPTLLVSAIINIIYIIHNNNDISLTFQLLYVYSQICLYLCLTSSILGLFGLIGWISTLYNTLMFIINSVFNQLIFCDQKYSLSLMISIIIFVFNIIGVVLSSVFSQSLLDMEMIIGAYCSAWGFAMLTAFTVKIRNKLSNNKNQKPDQCPKRFWIMFIIECLTFIIIFLVYFFILQPQRLDYQTTKMNQIIIIGINIFFFIFFLVLNQLRSSRTVFGCIGCLNLSPSTCSFIDLCQRYILRTFSTLSILAILCSIPLFKVSLSIAVPIWGQTFGEAVLFPVLVYRTFKKYLSHPRDLWSQIPLIIYFILKLNAQQSLLPIEMVLFFPLFPHNPLKILTAPFFIPKKLIHKNQKCYRIFYLLSAILAIIIFIGTLGVAEFTMCFGLPLFWCVIPKAKNQANNNSTHQNQNIQSSEYTVYKKFINEMNPNIFRGKKAGFYLIRVNKYILFVQLMNEFYGLFETITFVGLQAQQITTCHAKQGQTIDRIISSIWDQNQQNRVSCTIKDSMITAIWPIQQISKVLISGQNQIKLTGIIESQDFYKLFKKALLKSLIYYHSRLIAQKGQKPFQRFDTQCKQIIDELYFAFSKQKCDEIFPYQFAKKTQINYSYPLSANNSNLGRKKLPPIKKGNQKKQKVIDDLMDLLDNGQKSNDQLNINKSTKQQKIQEEGSIVKQQNLENSMNDLVSSDQKNMAVVLSLYSAVIGKINYLNIQKIYDILNQQRQTLSQINYQEKISISSDAVGAAFKIAIGKYLQDQIQVTFQDFQYYSKNQYLGTMKSSGFSRAVSQEKDDVWTVNYAPMKKLMTVKRIASVQTSMYILGMDWHFVKAIWNNLKFQLLYATNDDDQRYSIQTHEYLMRNLLVQACQQPFGYAGYYSKEIINY